MTDRVTEDGTPYPTPEDVKRKLGLDRLMHDIRHGSGLGPELGPETGNGTGRLNRRSLGWRRRIDRGIGHEHGHDADPVNEAVREANTYFTTETRPPRNDRAAALGWRIVNSSSNEEGTRTR